MTCPSISTPSPDTGGQHAPFYLRNAHTCTRLSMVTVTVCTAYRLSEIDVISKQAEGGRGGDGGTSATGVGVNGGSNYSGGGGGAEYARARIEAHLHVHATAPGTAGAGAAMTAATGRIGAIGRNGGDGGGGEWVESEAGGDGYGVATVATQMARHVHASTSGHVEGGGGCSDVLPQQVISFAWARLLLASLLAMRRCALS